MADISMCKGGECPDKNECYRHRAMPSPRWQTYFTAVPYNKQEEVCDMFLPIHTGDNLSEPTGE